MKQALVAVTLCALATSAWASEQHAWVKTVPDAKTWKAYSKTVGSDELEKSRAMIKGRFVLRTEAPQGLIMYGLRKEVLERRVETVVG